MTWQGFFDTVDQAESLLSQIEEEGPTSNEDEAEVDLRVEQIDEVLDPLVEAREFLEGRLRDRYHMLPQTVQRYEANLRRLKGIDARLEREKEQATRLPIGERWCGPR